MPHAVPQSARPRPGRLFARVAAAVGAAVVGSLLVAVAPAQAVTPEWRQEAEAFTTKTQGAQFSDANASGGAAWNLWTNGYLETSFTVATGAKQIDIVARGDAAGGVWPIMRVHVDNVLRTEETVASTTYQTYSTTISSLTSGSHTLRIEFANDAVVNGQDRNLKVDVASVIPASGVEDWRQEGEQFPTISGQGQVASDSLASDGKYRDMWTNGHIETTMSVPSSGTKQIVVIARGTPADGIWPNMRILVDGAVLANRTVGTTSWQQYTVTTTLSKGSHTLRIQFTNDSNVNGDRNLKVDVASLVPMPNEWKQEVESFTTRTQGTSTTSSLASAGVFWNLWANGYVETTMVAASSGRKEIRFVARGAPANNIFPIVKVYVGGTLVQQLTISSTTFSTYTVPATMNVGNNTLKIEYINNDTNLNGGDRNVHLDVATLIGDNAFPFVQGIPSPANNSYVGAQAALRATYADPDGDAGYVDFEVYDNGTNALVTSGQSALTQAGDVASWTPSGLLNGTQYRWRARAYDGTSYAGSWTANQLFTVDSTPPAEPSVSSTTFPSGSWSGTDTTSGSFTFGNAGSSDVVGYKYGLDVNPPRTDTTSTSVTLTPGEGSHTLYLQSVDRAGNLSPVRSYAFSVGGGAITSPRAGDATGKRFRLRAVSNPAFTGVTYEWRRAATDAWATVPASHVTFATGGGAVTWPVAMTVGAHADLDWDVATTLGSVDGPVEVRASFTGGSPPTTRGTRVTLDQKNSGAASTPVGSGAVNLLTGNLTLNATDVAVEAFASDLTVTRTHNSRDPQGGATGPFGPGWVAGVAVDSAASSYSGLAVSGNLRTVSLVDGDAIGFTAASTNTFVPEEGMESLSLTRTAGSGTPTDHTDDVYELADLEGNKTVFHWRSTAFVPTEVVQPGSTVKTTYTYETVGGVTRMTRALAPVPAGVTCTSPATTRGCRSLTFDYAPSSTPIPGAGGGDYPNRLRSVSLTAWDPAASAMATVEIARWSYNSSGRLLAAWDPRLAGQKTTYSYDAAGQVTTVTPAAEEPYTFAYTTIPGDSGGGRLRSVSRSALGAGTATTTFVYRVPVSGTGAPANLSATERARWGQNDAPTDATAVFPATQAPGDDPANGVLPTSYERANVYYLNVTGRQVNMLAPGGHLSVVEYDEFGNAVRELAASNRAKALDAQPADTAAQEAALASRLSTIRVYAADGQQLVDELGPEHEVALTAAVTDSLGRAWPAGALVRARSHTVNTYDQGAPAGTGPYHLVTTSATGARIADTTTDADVRTTTTTYDWTLRQPTSITSDPGGLNHVVRTSYDAATGLVTKSTLPGGTAAQDTAHTTVNSYYVAGTHPTYAECGNRPEWANLPCRVDLAAQPAITADRPAIPSKHYAYDLFNALTTTTEKNGATVLRTATTQYDAAHRPWRTSVTATTGEPLETVETYYDPATGKATETRTIDGTGAITSRITKVFDTLGRVTSYTDADGNVSTTTYDVLSRPVETNDGKGTQTRYYDEGSERRGLLSRLVDSAAGTFTATYDADGAVATQTLPNTVVQTTTRDETGAPVRLDYTKSGSTWLSFTVSESIHGQWVTSASSGLSNQAYGYDAAGRLVRVEDTPAGLGCTLRTYAVDADSNRTSMVTRQPTAEGECDSSATGSTTSYSYDAAARLTTSGYVYDALGRTTSVPAGDAAGKSLTVAYYVNDLVRSLTPQDGTAKAWTLDPTQQRFRSWTQSGVTKVNHYGDDGDSPAWVAEGGTAWTRNIEGIGGDLAAVQDSATGVTLQLVNLHGDVVATASTSTTATGPTATFESTEFGTPRDEVARRYGWLGGKQRSADAAAGVILMGVRLYNPASGRFLQVDPVVGGSDNPYDYAGHDPLNAYDLDGRWWSARQWRNAGLIAGGIGAAVACVGSVVCGVAAGAAIGAAWYANNTNRSQWTTKGFVKSAAIGGVTGGIPVGRIAFRSARFGAKSVRFGDKNRGAKVAGTWQGNGSFGLGWSGKRAWYNGKARTVFRAKVFGRHIDLMHGPWKQKSVTRWWNW